MFVFLKPQKEQIYNRAKYVFMEFLCRKYCSNPALQYKAITNIFVQYKV